MSVAKRNNVQVRGSGSKAMVFAHGFGCDQNMWRFVAPEFERDYRTVLFDHVGAGHSDLNAYDPARYSSLQGYADDLLEIGRELRLENAVFVGHSVSAMIGALASLKDPAIFESLIMVGPSPRYIDDEEYKGGFSAQQIEELLSFLEEKPSAFRAWYAGLLQRPPHRAVVLEPAGQRHHSRGAGRSHPRRGAGRLSTSIMVFASSPLIASNSFVSEMRILGLMHPDVRLQTPDIKWRRGMNSHSLP